MGLFSKKRKEVKKDSIRLLPELPRLPDFPELNYENEEISKLPKFPSSSFGTKFSQNTIKDAISGGKESDNFPQLDDFPEDFEAPQKPMKRPMPKDFDKRIEKRNISGMTRNSEFEETTHKIPITEFRKERGIAEPVFIRIDKFEEALKIFNDTKKKLSEMEEILKDIKKVKEKEEEELQVWENEIKNLKEKIEKVDREMFSKI